MFIVHLKKEIARLEFIKKQIESDLKGFPEGELRLRVYKGEVQAYNRAKFIRKDHFSEAQKLAQKRYETLLLPKVTKTLDRLKRLAKNYEPDFVQNQYERLNPNRKALVKAFDVSDQTYARNWAERKYTGKAFSEEGKCFYTQKHEKVRSKSEAIIANTLMAKNFEYRYEYPYAATSGKTIYPDFTVLNPNTRKEFILEHFGLLDNKEYLQNALFKIKSYAEMGFVLGKNFFFTYETSDQPFDYLYLEKLLSSVLECE